MNLLACSLLCSVTFGPTALATRQADLDTGASEARDTSQAAARDAKSRIHAEESDDARDLLWDRRAVEHLWNRAGFGVRASDVDRWVEAGPHALVDALLAPTGPDGGEPTFEVQPVRMDRVEYRTASEDAKREQRRAMRAADRQQMEAYRTWWAERILAGDDPLRDRMTLFWHGFFTTSVDTVRRSELMIEQHQMLRRGALGRYTSLLRGILRDPAMLVYLDNNSNRKGKPNENLAREVMELFSLGEGNYSESDIQEAARALTGHTVTGVRYRYVPRRHDGGKKTILGVTGRHDADRLADILLDQEACPRWLAGSLISYFEGTVPDEERLEDYANYLRTTGFDLALFLRRLFLDPDFYRAEVVGARVLSPVDYLAGVATRLDAEMPARFLTQGAALLGEDLFRPPNVKGWDGGTAWITTATFMQRGNLVGAMLGVVELQDLRDSAIEMLEEATDEGAMMEMDAATIRRMTRTQVQKDAFTRILAGLRRVDYRPDVSLTQLTRDLEARTDEQVVAGLADALLAIELPTETRRMLVDHLRNARVAAGIEEGRIGNSRSRSEALLRELAHLILSLPEAQLG